jgi:hypothetical protein
VTCVPDGSDLIRRDDPVRGLHISRFASVAGPVVVASLLVIAGAGPAPAGPPDDGAWARVIEDDRAVKIETDQLAAVIPKRNPEQWVSSPRW